MHDKATTKRQFAYIPGTDEQCFVSSSGEVFKRTGTNGWVQLPLFCDNGTWMVSIKGKYANIRKLVAEAFIPNPKNYAFAIAKNTNFPKDFSVDNTIWWRSSVKVNLRPYPTPVSAETVEQWLPSIRQFAENRLRGESVHKASGGGTGSDRHITVGRRIAHIARALSLDDTDHHSSAEEILRLVEISLDVIRLGDWPTHQLAAPVQSRNIAGHIYAIEFDNGSVKVGMTRAGRAEGSQGRLSELKRHGWRYGVLPTGKQFLSGVLEHVNTVEKTVHSVLKATHPNRAGEVYFGSDWDFVVLAIEKVIQAQPGYVNDQKLGFA